MMFAIRIRSLRCEKGLDQVQLAKRLGVSKQSISNWENGNAMPSVEALVQIADFFHVTTDYLLGREVQDAFTPRTLDVTGLTPSQIERIQYIVYDILGIEY